MNTALISLTFALATLAAFLLSLTALSVLTFVDTPYVVRWRKQRLLQQLNSMRLHTLLTRLGVEPAQYAEPLTLAALKQQLERCARCNATEQCDHATNRKYSYAYCPNAREIRWALREHDHPAEHGIPAHTHH